MHFSVIFPATSSERLPQRDVRSEGVVCAFMAARRQAGGVVAATEGRRRRREREKVVREAREGILNEWMGELVDVGGGFIVGRLD